MAGAMNSPAERPGGRKIISALAVVPVAYTCLLVVNGAVDVPWADDWALAPALVKLHDGGFDAGDLWAQHNEHRLVVARVVLLALALATGWDVRAAMALSVLLAAVTVLLLARQARRTALASGTPPSPWAPALLATVLFSFAAWQNWLWQWQVQVHLCVLAAVGGLSVLARPALGRREVGVGALLGVASTLSFGAGFAFWPAAALLLAARHPDDRLAPRGRALAFGGVALVLTALYLWGLKASSAAPGEAGPSLARAALGALAVAGALVSPGSTIPPEAPIPRLPWPLLPSGAAMLLGGAGAVALVALTRERLRAAAEGARRPLLFWTALGAFALGVAALCGLGRGSTWDPLSAVPSRYVTLSGLLWAALVGLLLVTTPTTSPRVARASGVGAAVIGLLALLGSVAAAPLALQWGQARADTARRLVRREPVPPLSVEEAAALEDVRRLRLTCFRPR